MDDYEFDFGQLDQLFNFLSSSFPPPPPPPPPPTIHQNQDSSISLQTQNPNLVITSTHHMPKKKSIFTNRRVTKKNPVLMTNVNIDQNKKVVRRDVERQRRRDMAKLYRRLRLLIPSKYLMGKRSISDHLEEIVDYIKDSRKNIEDLEKKRESLKEMKNSTCSSQLLAPSSSSMKLSDDEDRIIVKSCNGGVEISIKGGLSLSKVLKLLMKEGLIVNSCVSSTINQRLIHIIRSEVNTRRDRDIDVAMLQSKLIMSLC
ncbi:unnamed protein product [Withania somnifera]